MFGDVFQKIFWIGIGSMLGGNARFWLGTWVQQRWGGSFPMGTFIVNMTASFVLGFFTAFIIERMQLAQAPVARLVFAVGFVGSYSTFSTLEYETFALTESGAFFLAALNAFGSLICGFIAMWLGISLGRVV